METPFFRNGTPQDLKLPRGSLEVWEILTDEDEKKYLKIIWTFGRSSIAYSMDWDKESNHLGIGYRNGAVAILALKPRNNKEYDVAFEGNFSKEMIINTTIDGQNDSAYFLSKDRTLFRVNYKTKEMNFSKNFFIRRVLILGLNFSVSVPSSMNISLDISTGFIADCVGNISVMNIHSVRLYQYLSNLKDPPMVM